MRIAALVVALTLLAAPVAAQDMVQSDACRVRSGDGCVCLTKQQVDAATTALRVARVQPEPQSGWLAGPSWRTYLISMAFVGVAGGIVGYSIGR